MRAIWGVNPDLTWASPVGARKAEFWWPRIPTRNLAQPDPPPDTSWSGSFPAGPWAQTNAAIGSGGRLWALFYKWCGSGGAGKAQFLGGPQSCTMVGTTTHPHWFNGSLVLGANQSRRGAQAIVFWDFYLRGAGQRGTRKECYEQIANLHQRTLARPARLRNSTMLVFLSSD